MSQRRRAAVDRMAADMAHEPREARVAVVSLWPGIVATEMIMAKRKDQRLQPYMESPVYVGRAVVGLALDANMLAEYGLLDINGQQPSLEKGVWLPQK